MILMVSAVDIICNGLGPADMWQEAMQENMHIREKKRTGRNEEIMIRINQIKLPVTHDTVQLEQKIKKALKLKADTPFQYQIVKKSIDARKKPDLFYVYSVDVETSDDQKILKKVNNNNVMSIKVKKYVLPEVINPSRTPVIAGAGPAGLFCAYALMSEGFHPIVAERGKKVEERTADVQKFWETGVLDTASNVQFGEGGARNLFRWKIKYIGQRSHWKEPFCS